MGNGQGAVKNTYQHPGQRDWWQREASLLPTEASAETPPKEHGSQGATWDGRLLQQETDSTGSTTAPPLIHPQQPRQQRRRRRQQQRSSEGPRAEHVGNLGALSAAYPKQSPRAQHHPRSPFWLPPLLIIDM